MPPVNIDIATRATGNVKELDRSLVDEFRKQAYRTTGVEQSDYKYYSVMNADIYRTLIAQEMINSGNIAIKIEKLYVKSIQYEPDKHMMEFLYLSDSICSMLGFKLSGNSADGWLGEILDRVENINPQNENLIFGYDEIDNDFAQAWNCYEHKNYFEALSIAYDAKIKKGRFAEHYRQTWFPYLEERIRATIRPEYFNKGVNELSSLLTINNLDQEKLLYLIQQFELMIPKVADQYKSTDMKSAVLYKLYDAGFSAFCHVGNAAKALEYYEKCKQYAFYVGVDAFLHTNNKLIVCLEDRFEWEQALQIAEYNVASHQLASEMKREILKHENTSDFLAEAKAISQLARILAEQKDKSAEGKFREALDKLEKGSANYKITQSYLLHFYADMGMGDAFEEESADYFDGKTTYNQRLRYITNLEEAVDSLFSREYALYVLVRGLYCFHRDMIDDALWEELCGLRETLMEKDGKEPGGHPWEIIYKYLELLAIHRKDDNARKLFSQYRKDCLKYRGEIITALEQFGDAEIAEFTGEVLQRDRITNELAAYLREHFDALKNTRFSLDGRKRYHELEQYFTFMYR